MSATEALLRTWYAPRATPAALALLPLAGVFGIVAALRRAGYRAGALRRRRLPVPVVVVGNITVGGTGKTPFVIALYEALAARGFVPGVVSRGTGAPEAGRVHVVASGDAASKVGDEPLLMAQRGLRVAVGVDRVAAARALLAACPQCNVIIADDGLQHYALARDVEIAVLDGTRGIGNGRLLPAGPLREPAARLRSVHEVVANGPWRAERVLPCPPSATMHLRAHEFVNVAQSERRRKAAEFAGEALQAVAGIGHPERFFATLRGLGLDPPTRAFPDHHDYAAAELAFPGADAILMTEKDAVKCRRFADARCWYLRIDAAIEPALVERIVSRLRATAGPSTH